jgi:hypothetical protein
VLEARVSSTLFPCKNWVVFKSNSPYKLDVSRWRYATFAPRSPVHWGEKRFCLSKENHLCLKLQHLAHCFPVRTEFVFKGLPPANQNVFKWSFFQTGLFIYGEEHVSLERETFVLGAKGSSTMFTSDMI